MGFGGRPASSKQIDDTESIHDYKYDKECQIPFADDLQCVLATKLYLVTHSASNLLSIQSRRSCPEESLGGTSQWLH